MGKYLRFSAGLPGKHIRPKVVELRHLTVLQEHLPRLHEISLDVFEGDSVALVGSCEADKMLLLACLLGQIQPAHGEIYVMGASLPPLPLHIHRLLGVMPRQVERKPDETVAAYLQRFSTYRGVSLTNAQIAHYCAHYQLPPAIPMTELSHLQARIMALALALVHDPRLALLVEPLADLNEQEQEVLHGYLLRIQHEGRTLICTLTPSLAEQHFSGYDLKVRLEQGRLHF